MKRFSRIGAAFIFAFAPSLALAATDPLSQFISNIVTYIIQPIIGLLFALAFFMFAFGLTGFFLNKDPKALEKSKSVLLWGIVGLFIMVSAVSIIAAVTKSFCGTAFCTVAG